MTAPTLRALSLARRALKTALHHLDTARAQAGLRPHERDWILSDARRTKDALIGVFGTAHLIRPAKAKRGAA